MLTSESSLMMLDSNDDCLLLMLPPEVSVHIMSFLKPHNLLFFRLSCRAAHALVSDTARRKAEKKNIGRKSRSKEREKRDTVKIDDIIKSGETIEQVEFLRSLGYPLTLESASLAAEYRDVEFLKYVFSLGAEKGFQWLRGATVRGKLEILEFALQHGHTFSPQSYYDAAWGGSLKTIDWLTERNCERPKKCVCCIAAMRRRVAVFIGLMERGFTVDEDCLARWLQMENKKMIKMLLGMGVQWGPNSFLAIQTRTNKDVIEYALSMGCYPPGNIDRAGQEGNILILERCRQKGGYNFKSVLESALIHKKRAVFTWAHDNNIPIEEDMCIRACHMGAYRLARKLHELGLPLSVDCYEGFVTRKKLQAIVWLWRSGLRPVGDRCLRLGIMAKSLSTIGLLIELGCEPSSNTFLDCVDSGCHHLFEFFALKNIDIHPNCLIRAVNVGDLRMCQWLHAKFSNHLTPGFNGMSDKSDVLAQWLIDTYPDSVDDIALAAASLNLLETLQNCIRYSRQVDWGRCVQMLGPQYKCIMIDWLKKKVLDLELLGLCDEKEEYCRLLRVFSAKNDRT